MSERIRIKNIFISFIEDSGLSPEEILYPDMYNKSKGLKNIQFEKVKSMLITYRIVGDEQDETYNLEAVRTGKDFRWELMELKEAENGTKANILFLAFDCSDRDRFVEEFEKHVNNKLFPPPEDDTEAKVSFF